MQQTRTTPNGALASMQESWRAVVDDLPADTVWAIDAEFFGHDEDAVAVATRGVLSHDTEQLRFFDWQGSLVVDQPLRSIRGSIARGDLRCSVAGREMRFADLRSLGERLGENPAIGAEVEGAYVALLGALRDAR